MKWFLELWHALQRRTDLSTLWPACRDYADNLEDARRAFRLHMDLDPIYDHMSQAEKQAYVEKLK